MFLVQRLWELVRYIVMVFGWFLLLVGHYLLE